MVKNMYFHLISSISTQWQAGIGTAWAIWWSLWSTRSPASPPSSSCSCSPSSSPPCLGCRFLGANLTQTVGQTLTGSCRARWQFSRYPPSSGISKEARPPVEKASFLLSVRHAWAVSTNNKRARASYYLSDTKMLLPTDITFFFATNLSTNTSSLSTFHRWLS